MHAPGGDQGNPFMAISPVTENGKRGVGERHTRSARRLEGGVPLTPGGAMKQLADFEGRTKELFSIYVENNSSPMSSTLFILAYSRRPEVR